MKRFKNLLFLDSKLDVEKYATANLVRKDFFQQNGYLVIAMNPSAHSFFKKIKVQVKNTSPYFMNESHRKLLEKSEAITDWSEKNVKFTNLDLGIQHAYRCAFIYFMRFAVHNCLWMIEVILNSIDEHKPETISALASGARHVSSFYLEPEERHLGRIVKGIAQEKNIRFEGLSLNTDGQGNNKLLSLFDYLGAIFKFILKNERFSLWEKEIVIDNIINKKRPIFFTTQFYQLDKLADELREEHSDRRFHLLQGPAIIPIAIPRFLVRLSGGKFTGHIEKQREFFNNFVEAIENERKLFSYRDIYFGSIIAQKIKDNLSNYILSLMLWTVRLKHFIDATMPLLFISNGNRADDVIMSEICKQKNIPSVLISHGSHVHPKNNSEFIEWGEHGKMLLRAPFSHLALQTPVSERYLEVFSSSSSIIKTGPLIWGRPVDSRESELLFHKMVDGRYNLKDTRVILHAGTPKPSKSLRFYVYETPDEYIQALCELADAVEKIPNVILIIKFRPTFEIEADDIKTLVPFSEKVILSIEEPFAGVLGMADLLVSFSSTTIEEALQNRIPVLLYGGGGRYQHISAQEIIPGNPIQPSAVYHVKEAKDLEYAINKILGLDAYLDKNKRRELFNQYIYPKNVRTSLTDILKI